ncbi:MAG: methyl-accepting chemotaxis protein [Synechococcales cyanobacterium M58_A2018_015]|nr:methyl-accepting chemotaxis protein [Synechococcales cyanobacterium M58_A2018_015]
MTSMPPFHPSTAHSTPAPLPVWRRFYPLSIGVRLFIAVMGGALVGIGAIAFLFGEIAKYQAEYQIEHTLEDKVVALDHTLEQAELLANSLRTSALTFHARKAKTPDTYRQLVLDLFKTRPESVVGLGMGQSKNGLIPEEEWFFAYARTDVPDAAAPGQLLPPPDNTIRYDDGMQPASFYPTSDRYRTYFLPQKNVWAQPYPLGGLIQTTYYSQLVNENGQWLGTVFVDVDSRSFQQTLADPVLYGAGQFALLTETGQLIAGPATSETTRDANIDANTYEAVPGLAAVWPQVLRGQSGLVEGKQGYWAYARVPKNDWIAVAYVPYAAVFQRVALITVGGMLIVGIVMALVVALTVRYLNRRLRPILDECNRLIDTNQRTLAAMPYRDEIEQLSTSFFYLIEQLKADEERIRQEVTRTVQTEEQLKQAIMVQQESQALQTEVEELLSMVSAVEHGDLTVAAPVSPRITGLVADTLNRLVERLEQLMATILSAAQQVTQGADRAECLALNVADNARQQAQAITEVQQFMETIHGLTQEAAQQVVISGETLQTAQLAIEQGQQEIELMSQGLDDLQRDTQQIVKRTQTLTNYVGLAAQFAKDQKRIAAMTRILAVNASMLANRAAAQQDPQQLAVITREFETIAAQVNQLATQTNQSLVQLQQRTDQIQTVVSGLNHDVQEVSQQVTHFSVGVEQSQQAFKMLHHAGQQVATTEHKVIQTSQAIVEATQTVLQSVRSISDLAVETLHRAEQTREQAQDMGHLAQTLLHRVNFFRLRPHLPASQSVSHSASSPDGSAELASSELIETSPALALSASRAPEEMGQ